MIAKIDTKTNMKGKIELGIGAGLFILRFIPIYKLDLGFLGAKWLSLSQLSNICSTPLLGLANGCELIKVVDPIMWLAIIVLVGYGIFKMVKGDVQ